MSFLGFGRTSQIRTGDLYHVKAHRTRHNPLGLVEINTGEPLSCFSKYFDENSSQKGKELVSGPLNHNVAMNYVTSVGQLAALLLAEHPCIN